MSRRASIESRIVKYFETAPLDAARVVYGIVREKVHERDALEPRQPRLRLKRKPEPPTQAAS